MNLKQLRCKTCGEPLDPALARDGVIRCGICESVFTLPKTDADQKILDFLSQGEHDLDTGKFDDAYSAFYKVCELDPTEPEAYWGMALAEFKVQYLKDEVHNRLQPICCAVTEKKFIQNDNFKQALTYGTVAQITEYKNKASEIEYINGEFYKQQKSGKDYDCFICVKVSDDNGGHTADRTYADNIYEALKRKGFKPFFSERELFNVTGADYEARILYALRSSECMLVVCTNEKYLQTKWVKNEYSRFLKLVNDEEKESDAVTLVFADRPIEKLPGKNGKIQGVNIRSFDAIERITAFVEAHTPEAKRRRQQAEEEKKRKEEAILKQIEEQELKRKELEEKLNSIKNSASTAVAPASASVNSLLTRANQELQFDNRTKAREYYGRVLDAKPDCAEAWFGLALTDFNCTSDEELIAKINKTNNYNAGSYDILFDLNKNKNYIQAYKYADADLRKRIDLIKERVEQVKANYCNKIVPTAKDFYEKILDNDITSSYSLYARYALFLLKYNVVSDAELIDKIEKMQVIEAKELQSVARNLSAVKNTPVKLITSYTQIAKHAEQRFTAIKKGKYNFIIDKRNRAIGDLNNLRTQLPQIENYKRTIEQNKNEINTLKDKANKLRKNPQYREKNKTAETAIGSIINDIWKHKYRTVTRKLFLLPVRAFLLLGSAIENLELLGCMLQLPLIALVFIPSLVISLPSIAIITAVFLLITPILFILFIPNKIIKTGKHKKYCRIQRKLEQCQNKISNLNVQCNKMVNYINEFNKSVSKQQDIIADCDDILKTFNHT